MPTQREINSRFALSSFKLVFRRSKTSLLLVSCSQLWTRSRRIVFRDGKMTKIPAADLVIGDRVHLSLGNRVPADMRLVQTSTDTRFDRAVLTGESEAIEAAIDVSALLVI